MRLIVRGIRRQEGENDHREYDDFRDGIVHDLASEDFTGFWTRLASPAPPAPAAVAPSQPYPYTPESRHLLTLLSALCVT